MRRLAEARAWASRPAGRRRPRPAGRPARSGSRAPSARRGPRCKDGRTGPASPDGPGIPGPAEESAPAEARLVDPRPAPDPARGRAGRGRLGGRPGGGAHASGVAGDRGRDAGSPVETDPGEQLVEDRYAALQAWAEWSRNRERSAPRRSSRRPTPTSVTSRARMPIPDRHPAVGPRADRGLRVRLPRSAPRRRTTSHLTASSSPGSANPCQG